MTINLYDEYLAAKKSLTFEEMNNLQKELFSEIKSDAEARELYAELIDEATAYAKIRADWLIIDKEKKAQIDSSRTSAHNSVIIKFNMIARCLKARGKAAKWRDVLGYEEDDAYNRKRIGDFACFLVFINCLNAR